MLALLSSPYVALSAPAGCPILKNQEKQGADVVPALRAVKPNWETSLDLRKEGLEHRSAGGGKVGEKSLGPFLSLMLPVISGQSSNPSRSRFPLLSGRSKSKLAVDLSESHFRDRQAEAQSGKSLS